MKHLIDKYNLIPHPEGGYYREVYRSEQSLHSPMAGQERNAVTHIYFLLLNGQFSRFHKVIHDEVWNFYEGAPLKLVIFDENSMEEKTIGPNCDSYVGFVQGGLYQAAESTGEYSLVGCTVAPGFDFADFSFLDGTIQNLKNFKKEFPEYTRFL